MTTLAALTAREHERFFAEFVRWEIASGGPDPHMAVTGHLAKDEPWHERAWRVGCYLACYNVPTGIALWSAWPWERVLLASSSELEAWITEHWDGLAFRRERRAVRSRAKLTMHLMSYAKWVAGLPDQPWIGTGNYEAAWRSADQIYGVGRYIKHKLLEGLRRYCDLGVELNDIRARGGWSPRIALELLYPQHAAALTQGTTHDDDATAEMCAAWARETLAERYGLEVSYYDLQVMLCEYRESMISKRQYPGRSQDSELGYGAKLAPHWGLGPLRTMTDARAVLFPHECLGELQGWDGAREELGPVVSTYGYTWTDIRMDYIATRDSGDFANPVKWHGCRDAS